MLVSNQMDENKLHRWMDINYHQRVRIICIEKNTESPQKRVRNSG